MLPCKALHFRIEVGKEKTGEIGNKKNSNGGRTRITAFNLEIPPK